MVDAVRAHLRDRGYAVVPESAPPADAVEKWHWFEDLTGDSYAMARMLVRPSEHGTTYTSTMEHAEFHTDYLGAWLPPDLQALPCVRPAVRGGTSLLVDLWRLWARLMEMGVPFDELRTMRPGESLASPAAGGLMNYAFGRSFNLLGPGMEIDGLALTAFADREGLLHRIDLRAGDMLVFDNLRMGHGRTAFDDPDRLLEKIHSWRIDPVNPAAPFDSRLRAAARPARDTGSPLDSIGPDLNRRAAVEMRARNLRRGVVDLERESQQAAESNLAALFADLRGGSAEAHPGTA
jgi:hypothetical protein